MLEQAQIVTSSDPSIIQVTAAAEPAPAAQNQEEESPQRRSLWKMVLTIIALGAMSGLFLFFPIDWDSIGNWGYLGVFLVTFIATASFILPIPYLLIVARAGMFLNPL